MQAYKKTLSTSVFFVLIFSIRQKPLNLHNYLPNNAENCAKSIDFDHFSILLIN